MLLAGSSTGCVRVYHPMSNLHRPIVVDPTAPNLPDVELKVHCVPGGYLNNFQAGKLCQQVGTLFENQGATVTTVATVGASTEDGFDDFVDDPPDKPVDPDAAPATQLTLELRARKLHRSNHPLSWLASLVTFTVLPGITEVTFAQDVVIRDGSGFLLVQESLQGRMVRRFGVGAWVGNILLDTRWRKNKDRLVGVSITHDLSRDLYGQLSQSVFNAKMQAEVLQLANPGGSSQSGASSSP